MTTTTQAEARKAATAAHHAATTLMSFAQRALEQAEQAMTAAEATDADPAHVNSRVGMVRDELANAVRNAVTALV